MSVQSPEITTLVGPLIAASEIFALRSVIASATSSQDAKIAAMAPPAGNAIELWGLYFFGDFFTERIWSIEHDGQQATEFEDWTSRFVPAVGTIDLIVGFGEDSEGNLYIVDLGGEIFQVVPEPGALLQQIAGALALLGLARHRERRRRSRRSDTRTK